MFNLLNRVFKFNLLLILSLALFLSILLTSCSKDSNPAGPGELSDTPSISDIKSNESGYLKRTVTMAGITVTKWGDDNDEFVFTDNGNDVIKTDFEEGNIPSTNKPISIVGKVERDDGDLEIDVASWEYIDDGPIDPQPPATPSVGTILAVPESYYGKSVTLTGKIVQQINVDHYWFTDDNDKNRITADFDDGYVPEMNNEIRITGKVEKEESGVEIDVISWEYTSGTTPPPPTPSQTTVAQIVAGPQSFWAKRVILTGFCTEHVYGEEDELWFTDDNGNSRLVLDFEENNVAPIGKEITVMGTVGDDDGLIEVDVKSWQLTGSTTPPTEPEYINIISIRGNPSAWNGKVVILDGKTTQTLDDDDDEDYLFEDNTDVIKADFQSGTAPEIGIPVLITGRVKYEADENELEIDVSSWENK